MGLEPSFHCLFRRSRFSRSEDDQALQNQKEMFAVASVAFTLKHDKGFRAHFFREICGIEGRAWQATAIIEVQAHPHSDLVIKHKGSSTTSVTVIEFKVGAKLEDYQNPKYKTAFFANDGYGAQIIHDYREFSRKHYVVLSGSVTFKSGERSGLSYASRKWENLIGKDESMGGLWTDLCDSLSELGVDAFRFHKFKDMKNAQYTRYAVEMHETLSAVASDLKLRNSGESIREEGDSAWYGRYIPAGLAKFTRLESLVKPKQQLGWFGFQCGPSTGDRAFNFYCSSKESAKETFAFIGECVRNGPAGETVIDDTENTVYFQDGKSETETGDRAWFESVFEAVKDK